MIRWQPPGPYAVAFSDRRGGVSDGPFASLNLGLMTGDDPERVTENRRLLCDAVDAVPSRLALNRQVHGATVNRAESGTRGTPGDAIWSDEPELPLLTLTADCLPIALAATGAQPVLALVHAGWRGLLAGVIEAALVQAGRGAAAAVGPGIGPCCYEVGEEVARPYRARFGDGVLRGRNLDLPAAALRVLRDAGCAVEHIDLCTSCDEERFFSHRRDGVQTGRQGAIGLITAG